MIKGADMCTEEGEQVQYGSEQGGEIKGTYRGYRSGLSERLRSSAVH